jgi:serine/threonine protein phosphatase PrpC
MSVFAALSLVALGTFVVLYCMSLPRRLTVLFLVVDFCTFELLTNDHHPVGPEAERIRRLGGKVTVDAIFGSVARIDGALAVSRAMGDAKFRPFVTSTPEVVSRDVKPGSALLMACDGLWDVLSVEETVFELKLANRKGMGLAAAAEHLARLAIQRGTVDNVTVMVTTIGASD